MRDTIPEVLWWWRHGDGKVMRPAVLDRQARRQMGAALHHRLRHVSPDWLDRSTVVSQIVVSGGLATMTGQTADGATVDMLPYELNNTLIAMDAKKRLQNGREVEKNFWESRDFVHGTNHVTTAPNPGTAAWIGGAVHAESGGVRYLSEKTYAEVGQAGLQRVIPGWGPAVWDAMPIGMVRPAKRGFETALSQAELASLEPGGCKVPLLRSVLPASLITTPPSAEDKNRRKMAPGAGPQLAFRPRQSDRSCSEDACFDEDCVEDVHDGLLDRKPGAALQARNAKTAAQKPPLFVESTPMMTEEMQPPKIHDPNPQRPTDLGVVAQGLAWGGISHSHLRSCGF